MVGVAVVVQGETHCPRHISDPSRTTCPNLGRVWTPPCGPQRWPHLQFILRHQYFTLRSAQTALSQSPHRPAVTTSIAHRHNARGPLHAADHPIRKGEGRLRSYFISIRSTRNVFHAQAPSEGGEQRAANGAHLSVSPHTPCVDRRTFLQRRHSF